MFAKRKNSEGYIALMTAVIIAILLLTLVVGVSFSGFFGRFNILDSEVKERSAGLANGCIETAILKFAKDDTYTGNEFVTIGSDSCYIVSVEIDTPIAGRTTIKSQASSTEAYTNLCVVIDSVNYGVVNRKEVANFPCL